MLDIALDKHGGKTLSSFLGNKRARSVPQRMKKKDEKEKEKEGISIDLLRVLGAFYVALLL